ncbi:hypothetical protein [Roseovarius sp. C03]|uniref:hypothetical protein n=1 Tax=Roseovarius sp. C03 TaxID=3449222 RepID=UPI003EDCA3E6
MADYVEIVARLQALRNGQAVPITRQRQVHIQSHARVLTLLAMAGEDTSVHAVAIGRIGEAPQIAVTPDPRRRDDQYDLLRWLLPRFESYFAECRAAGTFPQIWVSSGGALSHFDTLADRLRFTDDDEVKRLGTLWTYGGERSPIAGQQALHSAASALRAHFVTGQPDAEDEHLGTLLTWIEPPAGQDILAAVATAEARPMGAKTDPHFDASELQPAVADYNDALASSAADDLVDFYRQQIQRKLETVIRPIYAATQQAIAILSRARWEENAALATLVEREAEEFARFMDARDAGYLLPYRDKPKAGAFKIVAREKAVANLDAATLRHDRSARERAVGTGAVLRATVTENDKVRLRPHKFEHRLVLSSHQDRLHLRSGDELSTLTEPKLTIRINSVERRGPFSWVGATVVKGMQVSGNLQIGETYDFGPAEPDWGSLIREMGQMAVRLKREPWTHSEGSPQPAAHRGTPPTDLLNAINSMTGQTR